MSSDAFTRHRQWMKEYEMYYANGKIPKRPKTKHELEVLQEHHKFIRDDQDSEDLTWEDELAKKWYEKLFREFALVDLKHYKTEGGIKLRWRTEDEVLNRIGELTCSSLRCKYHEPQEKEDRHPKSRSKSKSRSRSPTREEHSRHRQILDRTSSPSSSKHRDRQEEIGGEEEEEEEHEDPLVPTDLTTYQLDFNYVEQGQQKQALVKCILCKKCAKKLNRAHKV